LSIFIQIFLAGSERLFYFCKSDVSSVQGRSRSFILVPIESEYTTSYWSYHSPFGRYCRLSAQKL